MSTDFFILMKAELGLVAVLLILLFIKIRDGINTNNSLLRIANAMLAVNCIAGFFFNESGSLFGDMYHTNDLIALQKNFLNFFTLIISLQAWDYLKPHRHLHEFYMLICASLLGMHFMLSSGNMLMFYIGLELASLPIAVLVNFDYTKRRSSEAAVKMIFLSAFASAILLFGISLLYGAFGSLSFYEIFTASQAVTPLQIMALVFVFAGFAFKMSVVPFHFWTADVYEGAPVVITSYLSVISKGAMVFVFISVLMPLFFHLAELWKPMMTVLIVLTITVGNLFALRQNNLKRFLAFSSIAQMGYVLFGLLTASHDGASSAIYFFVVYAFSNLGAFGVVALISLHAEKENLEDYKGLHKTNPILAWALGISLFSLAGVPPTAGFFGKLFLLSSGSSDGDFYLLLFAALNMVVSLYYYLRIVKAIFIDQNEQPIPRLESVISSKIAIAICLAGIIFTGFFSIMYAYIDSLIK
ncbi:MAG: NADH-quinone oxidoreductase subunit N [Crocinitomicaceae bacterium]|nr:NADH-quinone oxidoreductase subunit N [Crocinitomicaceae bacterium]